MKYAFLLLFAAVVVQSSIDPIDYLFESYLEPEFAYKLAEGEQNNNRGFGIFRYDASTMKLHYSIGFTNSFFEELTINGPARCENGNQASDTCVDNTGPVLYSLIKGLSNPPENAEPRQNIVEGSVTLNRFTEHMLFDNDLYLRVSKMSLPIPGEKVGKLSFLLRGAIYRTSMNVFRGILYFGSSDGSYGGNYPKTKSTNQAVGYIRWPIDGNPNLIDYDVFHNIIGAGRFILQCGSKGEQISTNPTSPVSGRLDFSAEEKKTLPLSLFSGDCFFFFTSSALQDGDLFSRPMIFGTFYSQMTGAKVRPSPTSSANYATSVLFFDRSTKTLSGLVSTNITQGLITNVTVNKGSDSEVGTPLCSLWAKSVGVPNLPVSTISCKLTIDAIQLLEDEEIFVNIHTEANPEGELRGQITKGSTRQAFKAELKSSSGSLSEGAKIGLGVGIGVGVAIIIVGIIIAVAISKGK